MAMAPSAEFRISRSKPVLVTPAGKTPHELKYLSDIDDLISLRHQMPLIQFFRCSGPRRPDDPAMVIRDALAKTLVFYYPFAGRLREEDNRKLVIDCNAEGVLFIEAQANVTIDHFGDMLCPPFPHIEELLYDVPGSGQSLGCPLMLIQVTRLACGGLIMATRFNHSICDGAGIVQFLTAVGEIARGASAPTVRPVWHRELLCARNPPRVTCNHRQYEKAQLRDGPPLAMDKLVHRSFIFRPQDIAVLRQKLQPEAGRCSRFELLTACLWKCRTKALCLEPGADCRVLFAINVRPKLCPPLPEGYYGNVSPSLAAVTTAGELQRQPLDYAVKLVSDVKSQINSEYMRSLADLYVLNGRDVAKTSSPGTFDVSDATHLGLDRIDPGWGLAAYGGPAVAGTGLVKGFCSFYVPVGKDGAISVGISLPSAAMERFAAEVKRMINGCQDCHGSDYVPSGSAVCSGKTRSRM